MLSYFMWLIIVFNLTLCLLKYLDLRDRHTGSGVMIALQDGKSLSKPVEQIYVRGTYLYLPY